MCHGPCGISDVLVGMNVNVRVNVNVNVCVVHVHLCACVHFVICMGRSCQENELREKIAVLADNDPERAKALKDGIGVCQEAAQRWTGTVSGGGGSSDRRREEEGARSKERATALAPRTS